MLPIEAIARLAHERGAIVAVDGAQAAGAIPLRVTELGVDFYAIPGQKWLLGPEGTGALWASPGVTERRSCPRAAGSPTRRSGSTGRSPGRTHAGSTTAAPTALAITGLARSCGWLSMYVGLPWIHERGRPWPGPPPTVSRRSTGVEMLTPRDRMATLVTFRLRGWDAETALTELAARTFAIARTIPPLDALRISVGFFTTEDEIERVATAVELLAAHTPETLPQRARLTILGQGDPG